MSTFQVKGNNGTTVRIQTQTKKVFRVDGALRGPKGATGPAGNDGEDGRDIELQNNGTHVQWRYVGDEFWTDLIDVSILAGADGVDGTNGIDGTDGREIELQVSATHIQWRYSGDVSWTDLIAIASLKGADGADGYTPVKGVDYFDGANGSDGVDGEDGREVEFQKGATHIQWRYVGDAGWIDLVALVDLKGADGTNGSDGTDGIDGRTTLSGAGAPAPSLGEDGDFYINTSTYGIYGPKTAGAWGSPTSLVGPAGSGTGDMLASVYDPDNGARQVAFKDELGGGGVTDHGALTGLADDDHTQYHNDARGDARYYTQTQVDTALGGKSDIAHTHDDRYYTETEVDTALAGKSNTGHGHTASDVSDFDTEVGNQADVAANTAARHSHANKAVLDATEESYTTAEKNKLAGVEAGAEVNEVSAVDIADFETTTELNGRDVANRSRSNHTGGQAISTVTGLQTELDAKVAKNELVFNAKDFGAVGDNVADDTAAIQLCIDTAASQGGRVFVPAGTYRLFDELKLPSNSNFSGAGIDVTTFFVDSSTSRQKNAITNVGNTRLSHTVPDVNIRVADFTVDSNGFNRTTGGSPHNSTSGCGIGFACVENVVHERIRSIRGSQHCFDVGASIYPVANTPNVYPPGPSVNVSYYDCIAEDSSGDDGFTCHCSFDVRYYGCKALRTDGTPLGSVSQGFEVDDGMRDVLLDGCYASGYARGYQAKGHTNNPPARRVTFRKCVAENNSISFSVGAPGQNATHPSIGYRMATDILIEDCTSLEPLQTTTSVTEFRAIEITGYDSVIVRNFRAIGGVHNNITIATEASNCIFENIIFDGAYTTIASAGQGAININSSAGAGHVFRNITTRTPIAGPLLRNSNPNGKAVVEKIDGILASSAHPAVLFAALNPLMTIDSVTNVGGKGDIEVSTGDRAGIYAVSIERGVWNSIALDSAYTSQGGAPNRWKLAGRRVTLDVNIKQTSGASFPASDVTINTGGPLPPSARPSGSMNLQLNNSAPSPIPVVVNSSGLIIVRFKASASTTYAVGQISYEI